MGDKMDFISLSSDKQKEYFEKLSDYDKKQLVNSLELEDLKKFIVSFSNEYDRKKIYAFFDNGLLKKYYDSLSQSEKTTFLDSIQELQIDLSTKKNESIDLLDSNVTNITKKENENIASKAHIAELKQDIRDLKKQIKDNKVTLRQLDKDRKKKLAAQIRAAKPSALDRIGFISKYRANKLVEKTKELEKAEQLYQNMVDKDNTAKQSLETARHDIEVEKQNIKNAKQSIIDSRNVINQEQTNIKNLDIQIKRLSKEEKRTLGRKLYGQRLDTRNRIMTIQKQQVNTVNQTENVTQEPVQPKPQTIEPQQTQVINPTPKKTKVKVTKKTSTKATADAMMTFIDEMAKVGITFSPNMTPINNIQNGELLNNAIKDFNYSQAITAIYFMGYMSSYMAKMQQEMQTSTGKVRGFINIPLLIGLIFMLCNIILYIKFFLN